MIKYIAKGIVLGNYWGGGQGYYKAKELEDTNLETLEKNIEEQIENGSLDSGMGYESLIGALMQISTIETRNIDERAFINTSHRIKDFGKFPKDAIKEAVDILTEVI